MKYVFYAFLFFTLIACSSDDDDQILCIQEFNPSLIVTVVDSDSNFIEEATVTVIENEFTLELSELNPGVYFGPNSRPGVYLLTIMKEGFQDITVTDPLIVSLTEDICNNVDTIEMTFEMQLL